MAWIKLAAHALGNTGYSSGNVAGTSGSFVRKGSNTYDAEEHYRPTHIRKPQNLWENKGKGKDPVYRVIKKICQRDELKSTDVYELMR